MIPYNKPFMTGLELDYIDQAHSLGRLAGDGEFTKFCHAWLEQQTGCEKALLTHSCTAALEMSAILLNIGDGDEVIMPSYTFVSTANAFVLRGAVPVFIDIRPDTLNIDEALIEDAITERTKAICVVHYAGVGCEMDTIMEIADRHGLFVIEDAAQAIMSKYKGKALGSFGQLATLSFHETKNLISGEGGALLVNDASLIENAEMVREKGTDRSRFFRGQVDKYTWRVPGSSYLPGELIAAFLRGQLENAGDIQTKRISIWNRYREMLEPYTAKFNLKIPTIPSDCEHNAHIFYVILDHKFDRDEVLSFIRESGCGGVFHYVPLHSSPAGKTFAKTSGTMTHTDDIPLRLIRLPLWIGISRSQQQHVVNCLIEAMSAG
ncbi:MAG: dTDP-4-amino-4,6-dideoxygalactose transaminase [Pseudomonadota bacterium]